VTAPRADHDRPEIEGIHFYAFYALYDRFEPPAATIETLGNAFFRNS
jgi:hypothetical protein